MSTRHFCVGSRTKSYSFLLLQKIQKKCMFVFLWKHKDYANKLNAATFFLPVPDHQLTMEFSESYQEKHELKVRIYIYDLWIHQMHYCIKPIMDDEVYLDYLQFSREVSRHFALKSCNLYAKWNLFTPDVTNHFQLLILVNNCWNLNHY